MNVSTHINAHSTRAVLVDVAVLCSECRAVIPAGSTLVMRNDPARPFAHDGTCPKRWTPVLIAGQGTRSAARQLPLLEVVR